ncbi:hypothetical protein H257_16519 [Aphanomyces astaci]|uniref:Uncharacterized protein n=1 Tax=Aphanomyces astaci TaxID=112090 RepID=W4FIG8_APHAT|nr:hypothetical protein H257_16519 [Aphanomyces astaci]ETV67285.1 hypothetical protein H257_16519 [Aphanomyces astaci]|eukprot:XP_009843273.1 hypothetical protein H257_16519 [Aphanomyces astaci]
MTRFTIVPNTFVIRTLNLTDSANYLASSNVSAHAFAQGWASPTEPFDFTSAYGYAAPNSSKPVYGGRRMWRAFDLVAPSLHLDATLGFHARIPTYPLSVKPDVLLSPITIMNLFSNYYKNTSYDLTTSLAAGPFHDPSRYSGVINSTGGWERSLSMHRTVHSFVLQTRSNMADAIGGVAWYAQGVPADSVYFPISCGQTTLPTVFNQAIRSKFDTESTWWAFHIGYPADWANQTEYVLYPQHYHPPAQVAAEENRTAAVDPDTGVLSIVVGGADLSATEEHGAFVLPKEFMIGFVYGTMSLTLVGAVVVLFSRMRQVVGSPVCAGSVEGPVMKDHVQVLPRLEGLGDGAV